MLGTVKFCEAVFLVNSSNFDKKTVIRGGGKAQIV